LIAGDDPATCAETNARGGEEAKGRVDDVQVRRYCSINCAARCAAGPAIRYRIGMGIGEHT
jgi:hypothetical protein